MCGFIGFLSKSNDTILDIFNNNYPSILDRGITLDTVCNGSEHYGYVRLPTDAIKKRSIDKLVKKHGGYLLYNGLLTNVEDLAYLFALPKTVRKSDTLSLHYGFSKYNLDFLSHCRGMFAFAYIEEDTVTLVRDSIGIKPLYYTNTKNIFGFCSEMKGLRKAANTKVYEVLPGQVIIYNKKTKKLQKKHFHYKSYKRYSPNNIQECLVDSVVKPTQRYLQQSKTKRIAILLSGGIDSSLIAGLLMRHVTPQHKKRIIAFCVGLPDANDTIIAKKVASFLGIQMIHVLPYTEQQAIHHCSEIVYRVESKYSRVIKVAILQDALAKKIREMNIDVVISGEGADELFYGYERFIEGLDREQIKKVFNYFFKKVFYYTLLQRFDRIFAKRQIEGRVPFLDQELIVLAQKYATEEKIKFFSDNMLSKIPLRDLAKKIGLPADIYMRAKVKMTQGSTNQQNQETGDGYLESYVQQNYKKSFGQMVRDIYYQHFSLRQDLLAKTSLLGSEENAMEQVKQFTKENLQKEEYRVII